MSRQRTFYWQSAEGKAACRRYTLSAKGKATRRWYKVKHRALRDLFRWNAGLPKISRGRKRKPDVTRRLRVNRARWRRHNAVRYTVRKLAAMERRERNSDLPVFAACAFAIERAGLSESWGLERRGQRVRAQHKIGRASCRERVCHNV